MSRTRLGYVSEPIKELQALNANTADAVFQKKLAMLITMRGNPYLSHTAIAERIGSSERTVRRWWRQYTTAGLAAMFGQPRQDEAKPRTSTSQAEGPEQFLKALAPAMDPSGALANLGHAITSAYPEIARVHFRASALGDHPTTTVATDPFTKNGEISASDLNGGQIVEPLILALESLDPAAEELAAEITLWPAPPLARIPQETGDEIVSILPFIWFVVDGALARLAEQRHGITPDRDPLSELAIEYRLTQRERDIAAQHMYGKGAGEIAEQLGMTVHTVRKYIKSIHRKTGCCTAAELFSLNLRHR